MFDICDYCTVLDRKNKVHELREHCTEGHHCNVTGADCNAAWHNHDHPSCCCICLQSLTPKTDV